MLSDVILRKLEITVRETIQTEMEAVKARIFELLNEEKK